MTNTEYQTPPRRNSRQPVVMTVPAEPGPPWLHSSVVPLRRSRGGSLGFSPSLLPR